jgi:hypothetical protein
MPLILLHAGQQAQEFNSQSMVGTEGPKIALNFAEIQLSWVDFRESSKVRKALNYWP